MRWSGWMLALIFACHHDPAPTTPADKPPLPPSSGTPVGFLIDDATDLHLTDDQLGKLHEIDTSLAAELEVIDARIREANRPVEAEATPPSGRRGGGRRGGMGGGGMSGGMGGGGAGGAGKGHHKGAGVGSGASSSGAADKLTELRNADVREALKHVFDILQPAQQVTAKQVLADHDVDLDPDTSAPAAGPSPPGAPPPTIPPPGGDDRDPAPEP